MHSGKYFDDSNEKYLTNKIYKFISKRQAN